MKLLVAVGVLATAVAPSAVAIGPAERTGKQDKRERALSLRMLDARVNLPDSLQRATAARSSSAARLAEARQNASAIRAAISVLARKLPGLEVKLSSLTGAPESVRSKGGPLTGPAAGRSSADVVRDFLRENGGIYGLSADDLGDVVVLGDSAGGSRGLRMVRMEQQVDGRPVFQSETRFLLDRQGRLVKSVGRLVPHARSFVSPAASGPLITAPEAVVRLLESAGRTGDVAAFTITSARAGVVELAENDELVAGPITAREVLFPLAPGLLVPAWSLVVFTSGEADWYALVDQQTGDLLWRKNIRAYASNHDARFRVYVQADGTTPADSPAPASPNTVTPGSGTQFAEIAPTTVSMHTAMDATASPNGWIEDCPGGGCTVNETQTLGNNVRACLDRDVGVNANVCDTSVNSVLDGNGRPTGNPDANGRDRDFLGLAPRDFQTTFTPPPQGGAANAEVGQTATGDGAAFDVFRRGAVTHLFYISNWYHDKLFALGFDEASGNFQQTNFSGMGAGNDRVNADAQDGSGTNNANFSTPPDGFSGRMQMFRFTGPTIDRDGGIDAEIVFHELTHGTSNRLVGNAAGLNWDPAAGLGEGWSDFYSLALLNNTNADIPSGHYAEGGYATYKLVPGFLDNYLYGIRRFPYTTDNSVNPMTWADVDDVTNNLGGGIAPSPIGFNNAGGMEVHNSGEIWALTLWEVRGRIIGDPNGANGDVPTGNQTTLQIVTDALKMTPIDPTFTEARDAILDADCATNACLNEDSIWGGFADRGLGYGAGTPYNVAIGFIASHMGIKESFSAPFLDVANPAVHVVVDDSGGNNNGAIDPGEPVLLTVTLTNPWRAAGKSVTAATATLTSATPGVTIVDGSSIYGPIPPQGTAAGDTFLFTLSPSAACGSSLLFSLTTTSNLGTTSTSFRLRVGARTGTDPVVTYTGDPTPNIAIPDNRGRGIFHTISIADDKEIADLDFRVDGITHTFVDDVNVMLRAPGGTGIDMVGLIGLNHPDQGSADNIANMVIDDDLPFVAANDMIQAANAAAPFNRSWVPVYNSPSWASPTFFGVPGDPVGSLTRFDGLSTQGDWTVEAADEFGGDTGTLNAWSMLVTPAHFVCTPFTPTGADLSATKTDGQATAVPGQAITYTIVISNSGPLAVTGASVTDTVSAAITGATWTCSGAGGGTCTTSGSGSINDTVDLPVGGSVTYTLTGTIDPSATGSLSNTATVTAPGGVTDPNPANNSATDTDTLTPQADLSITKTDGQATEVPGTPITYTIVASNSGPSAVTGATVTDTVPAAITGATWTCTGAGGGTCTAGGSGNINDTVDLPVGATVTYTLTGTVSSSATSPLSNTATVTAPSGVSDPNPANNSSTDTDTIPFACGAEIVIVPDGRLTESVIPASGTIWFGATLRIGNWYSLEFKNTSGDNTPPGTLTVFSGNDGCSGMSMATSDTSGVDPGGTGGIARVSFGAAGTQSFFRARLANGSGAPIPFSFGWSDTTMYSPAWSTNGSFDTFYSFQNTTGTALAGVLTLLDTTGAALSTFNLSIPAGQTTSTNTASLGVARNRTGTARFTHTGPPGAIVAETAIANFSISPAYVQPVKFQAVREAK